MKSYFLICTLFFFVSVQAQQQPNIVLKPEKEKGIIDTEIASMAKEISTDSIKSYIQKMVSFGTRHSLSDTISNTQGIGAARRWVALKFKQFGERNKASMHVELDAYTIDPTPRYPRIPHRVTMKNVLGKRNICHSYTDCAFIILLRLHLWRHSFIILDSVVMMV